MKNILITNNSPENLNDVFQLLNNAQKYGNNFKFIRFNFESNKNNNDSIPDEYIDLIKIFSKYCYELNLNILKIKNLIIRLHQIYEEFKPDIVVVWGNKVDSTGGVLYEFSKIKKLKIFFSENTPIPGTFYIEKKTRFEFIKELSSIKNTVNKNKYEYLVKRGRKIVNKILHELPTRHQFNNKKIMIVFLHQKKIKF